MGLVISEGKVYPSLPILFAQVAVEVHKDLTNETPTAAPNHTSKVGDELAGAVLNAAFSLAEERNEALSPGCR